MFRVFPQDHWLLFGRYLVAIFATRVVLVAIWSLFVSFGRYLVAILLFWSLFGRYLVAILLSWSFFGRYFVVLVAICRFWSLFGRYFIILVAIWSLFVGFGPNALTIGVSMLAHIKNPVLTLWAICELQDLAHWYSGFPYLVGDFVRPR